MVNKVWGFKRLYILKGFLRYVVITTYAREVGVFTCDAGTIVYATPASMEMAIPNTWGIVNLVANTAHAKNTLTNLIMFETTVTMVAENSL